MLSVEAGQIQLSERQLFGNRADFLLRFHNRRFVRVLEPLKQLFALFGIRAQIHCIAHDPRRRIARGICHVDAEIRAETGFLGAIARQCNHRSVFTARRIERIHRLGQKHAVEQLKAPRVARPHAEHHEILIQHLGRADFDVLSRNVEFKHILHLREERALRAFDGFQNVQPDGFALVPYAVIHLTGASNRENQRLRPRDFRVQPIQIAHCDFLHAFAPPLDETTLGSASVFVKSISGWRWPTSSPA